MENYSEKYKILSSDADMYRRLRLSRLVTLLQEAAIAHTESLGAGREKTLDRGFLWALVMQEIRISRIPVYDDVITVESAPGKMMHTFYPRYYKISDKNGVMLQASALWVLMDRESRAMLSPERTGVTIDDASEDFDAFMPSPPRVPSGDAFPFTVPYSYSDLNGHMNNARYFDLADDTMSPALRCRDVKTVRVEFTGEARPGDTVSLQTSSDDSSFLLSGSSTRRLFRLGLEF